VSLNNTHANIPTTTLVLMIPTKDLPHIKFMMRYMVDDNAHGGTFHQFCENVLRQLGSK